jgi:hypothetical protein
MFNQLTEELLDLGVSVYGARTRFLAQSSGGGSSTTTSSCWGSSSGGYVYQ